MNIKYNILALTLLVFGLSSCETTEKIDDFPLRPSKMVLNCYFNEGGMWEFQVSKSLSVLDNADIKLLKDAKINLFKDGVLIDTINTSGADSWYRSDRVLPVEGGVYSIEATSEKFTTALTAEEYVPRKVDISDVSLTIRDSTFYYNYYYPEERNYYGNIEGTFDITFTDPPGEDNYYELTISSVDSIKNYYYQYNEFGDFIFDEFGNRIIDSISVEVYKNPLWFTATDAAAGGNGDEGRSVMFNDFIFDGQDYKVNADFQDWDAKLGKVYEFQLVSLTKNGHLYRKSVEEYQNASGDPFAEPVRIYSNIENGLGIFAAFSTSTYSFVPL